MGFAWSGDYVADSLHVRLLLRPDVPHHARPEVEPAIVRHVQKVCSGRQQTRRDIMARQQVDHQQRAPVHLVVVVVVRDTGTGTGGHTPFIAHF